MRFKTAPPRRRFGRSKSSRKREDFAPSLFAFLVSYNLCIRHNIADSSAFVSEHNDAFYLNYHIRKISHYQTSVRCFFSRLEILNNQSADQFTKTSSAKQAVLK